MRIKRLIVNMEIEGFIKYFSGKKRLKYINAMKK
jgi:hypothetical protein